MNSDDEEWGAGDIIMDRNDPIMVKVVIGVGAGKFVSAWATLDAKGLAGGTLFDSMEDFRRRHDKYIKVGSFTFDCMKEIEDVLTAPYREGKD